MTYQDPAEQIVPRVRDSADPAQQGLFDAPRARNTDPDTSHEAAESMKDAADLQRARCLGVLAVHGPATADDIDAWCEARPWLRWRTTTAGRRLPELLEAELVEKTDEKRATRSGRMAYVWRATKKKPKT